MSDQRPAHLAMRAWRVHEWGQPLDVLQLDTVPVPEPGPGEVRVQVQAIPLNLNDLERITGGNMMVRPELPCTPGMEVMGVVDACGPGAEEWHGKRVVATPKGATGGYAEFAICPTVSTFEMPEDIPLPDAAALYFPFHLAWLGLFDRGRAQGRGDRADPCRRRRVRIGGDPARGACRRARVRHRRIGREATSSAVTSALTSPSTTRAGLRRGRPGRDRQPRRRRGVRQRRRRRVRAVAEVHGLQRALSDDGLRVRQDQGRRAVHRASSRHAPGTSSSAACC